MRRTGARMRRRELIVSTDLGKFIRDRRRELGLSQDDVAKQGNLRQEWLSRVELGEVAQPETEKLARLATVLEVDLETLLEMNRRVRERAVGQIEQVWATSSHPAADLWEVMPYLDRDQIVTLLHLARVMAFGKVLSDGEG